jgi:hypothetical protein
MAKAGYGISCLTKNSAGYTDFVATFRSPVLRCNKSAGAREIPLPEARKIYAGLMG